MPEPEEVKPSAGAISIEDAMRLVTLAVQEMKKPTELEQIKIDKEHAKEVRAAKDQVDQARAEMERHRSAMDNCPHATTHPSTGVTKHQWRAQVHTPKGKSPYFVPTCTQCHSQLAKIAATNEMLMNGVALENYPSLNREALEQWAKRAPGE